MKLLTAEQVSERFQIKVRQVKELARQGRIPAVKIGRLWRFPEESLKDWIQKEAGTNKDENKIEAIANQIISEVS